MLGDFEHEALSAVRGVKRIQNFRHMAFEMHVNDGADDLCDFTG